MGERLLCKQEVVGSIPSGSTSRDTCSSVEKTFPRRFVREAATRVISDIVKR